MSWSDPFTWTAGLKPTAGNLNTALRDNIRASGGPRSTTPPTATDEQEWVYPADTTNGVNWALKYNAGSGSTYKWELIGGGYLFHQIATDESTASTTYVDLATVGPTLTVPRAGDYEIAWDCASYNSGGAPINYAAVKKGAAATADADAITWVPGAIVATPGETGCRRIIVTGLSASDIVKIQYRTTSGTVHFLNRALYIRPVRVS